MGINVDEEIKKVFGPVETGKAPQEDKETPIIDDSLYFYNQETEDLLRTQLLVRVTNLASGEFKTYGPGIPPRKAVICAYAQAKGDWNTWDYDKKYDSQVKESESTFLLGDWSAFKYEWVMRNYS